MNTLFLASAIALACAAQVLGQTAGETVVPSDVFEIGGRTVRIPPPHGFTKIGLRYGHILSVQEAAEPAENEIFAIHLPTDELSKYLTNYDREPDFFTKVSVSRIGRNENITPTAFSALRFYIEKEFAKMTDPESKEMRSGEKYVSKNLTHLLESGTKVKFNQPVNLGVIDKNDRVYSTLALLNLSVNKKPYKFLGTVSFVYVNMRLVYVYAYKSNPVEADAEMLSEFTRKWTASIIAENEELNAKSR